MMNPLISAHELQEQLGDPDLVVVDSRWAIDDSAAGRRAFDQGHIPGARFVDLETDLSQAGGPGRHPLPTHEDFAESCGRLGIDSSVRVVIYDDRGGGIAARMWWMLVNQGHPAVSVLDGGLDAWQRSGGRMTDDSAIVTPTTFTTRPWRGTVDRHDVEDRSEQTTLIDVRASERYRGDEEPIDPIAGHIPGALSMPWEDNLRDDLTFASPPELRERYRTIDIDEDRPLMVHCGSGVTACHSILALTVAGIRSADLYVGSWSDWASADLPVATGDGRI